jgi:hypothetical protein
MRPLFLILFAAVMAVSCQQSAQQATDKAATAEPSAGAFGESFATQQAIPAAQVASLFSTSDTVQAIISGEISASCKHSGCWMDMDMGAGNSVHVTFEEEKFTIPLDAAGKKTVAQGMVIREMIPVETLQNYAREEGKSEEEVALITEPVWAYEMIATGVLIEE